MNPTQIFESATISIYSKNRKNKSNATGPNPWPWPNGTAPTACLHIVHMAHGHAGCGPRPRWAEPASGLNPRWPLTQGPSAHGARRARSHDDGTARVARPAEAHRTHGRGALRHGQWQEGLRRQWHSPATWLGRQGRRAGAAARGESRGRELLGHGHGGSLEQHGSFAPSEASDWGWRGGCVRRGKRSVSDRAVARLTERRRR
jgi:hypothetical protein